MAQVLITAGYSVVFTTLAKLAQVLESASHPGLMRQRLRRYIAPSLLVIDEVGYTKLSQEQAHLKWLSAGLAQATDVGVN